MPWAASLLILLALAVCAAPWLAPQDPVALDLEQRLLPPGPDHPLGTDQLGRDLLARLLYGGRSTLSAAALATVGSLSIGLGLGVLGGYFGGPLDAFLGGATEVALALPGLTLALALAGLLGPSLGLAVLALIAISWTVYARVARAAALVARERPHILAARALGAGHARVVGRHLLPELWGTVIVLASLDFSAMLLALAGLGFIGLGMQPPQPEWGAMLADGRGLMQTAPQLMLLPGACLALAALLANLAGDALRDRLDPRLQVAT